ncbi:MAG: DUF1318 domain-containing protein [Candidatus Omnitrophica bacterium]|nr:DUF1318 domain-containing protein [Candidatus Omnitrophota bacterium]
MKAWHLSAVMVLGIVVLGVACSPKIKHKVEIETTKPIVIDVKARIDIYQHAADIEDMVSGKKPISVPDKPGPKSKESSFLFISAAYAEESKDVEAAIRSRRDRFEELKAYKSKGNAGEAHTGMVSIKDMPSGADEQKKLEKLIADENRDREIIYKDVAEKKGIPISEIRETFAKAQRDKAGAGEWIEVKDEKNGWIWKQK